MQDQAADAGGRESAPSTLPAPEAAAGRTATGAGPAAGRNLQAHHVCAFRPRGLYHIELDALALGQGLESTPSISLW